MAQFNTFISPILAIKDDAILDKQYSRDQYIKYMLTRTQSMFVYDGLPESLPARMLELYIQTNGVCCIAEHEGKLYAFTGGMGGELDEYYRPLTYVVANPYLRLSKSYKIGIDCVLFTNDSLWQGFMPMFSRYSELLTENDISIRTAEINMRMTSMISAPDDKVKKAGEKYLTDIEAGKLGVVGDNAFLDGIKAQPLSTSGSTSTITQLIELEQYLKGSWFNEIGLQANYNMKREALNSSETTMDIDALVPLIDDMLKCREEAVEQINKMFGTNISVEIGSSWKARQDIANATSDEDSGQSETTDDETENSGQSETTDEETEDNSNESVDETTVDDTETTEDTTDDVEETSTDDTVTDETTDENTTESDDKEDEQND